MSEMNNHVQQLFAAIQNANVEQVKQLLALGVDLEQTDENGRTALTLAASIGNSELINLLTSAGANVNIEPEPLTFNPRISTVGLPRGQNLGDLISQATADAPEEVKNFYDGFMSFVEALSDDDDRDHQARHTEQLIDDDEFIEANKFINMDEDDDYDEDADYDEDEDLAETPLGAAVLQGDVNTVRTLLQAGANPNPSAWHQTPVLVAAARKGYVEIVQALIAAGANVNRGFDELPLHTAAEAGHLEVVRLLLDAGAEVEGYKEDYWTALMDASFSGHLPIVQLLVERGADVNAWSQGETPLMLAARGAHREVYAFLYPLVTEEIRAIGDRDAEAEMATTVKHVSREQNTAVEKLIDAAMDGNLKRVEQYIANGIDVNAIGSCERTALSLAIQGGHIPIIEALLAAGADPNLPDEMDAHMGNNYPLMIAASTFFATNRSEMVRLLIHRGAVINQQDAEGQTALMRALRYSAVDVMEVLIQSGADLNIKDNDGHTALMMAVFGQSIKAVNLLKTSGASREGLKEVELLQAIELKDVNRVQTLLQGDVNVNARIGQTTALCQAAMHSDYEIVKLLIEAGADVDQRSSEGSFNPLLEAAYEGNLEVVRILLDAGADVHVRGEDDLNPLEYAELGKAEGNDKGKPFDDVIALLERYGATRSKS